MIKDITLRRLKDVKIKGNFTIKCDQNFHYNNIMYFFGLYLSNKISFKKLSQLNSPIPPMLNLDNAPIKVMPYSDKLCIIIIYESLQELLKLREIFQIRAGKFETYLINKREYDPFTPDFFDKIRDPIIYKVRK